MEVPDTARATILSFLSYKDRINMRKAERRQHDCFRDEALLLNSVDPKIEIKEAHKIVEKYGKKASRIIDLIGRDHLLDRRGIREASVIMNKTSPIAVHMSLLKRDAISMPEFLENNLVAKRKLRCQ